MRIKDDGRGGESPRRDGSDLKGNSVSWADVEVVEGRG